MDVVEFLKRASSMCGYKRERYSENNIPTTFGNLAVMIFYGDQRSEFVLSSLLLHRLKELHNSKYLIFCSFPGREGLYPYVDEYWSLEDENLVRKLAQASCGMGNLEHDGMIFQQQQLNRYFPNIINLENYYKYYDRGFTKEFFDEFKWIKYYLPPIPSSKIEFNRVLATKAGFKVFLHPSRIARAWSRGRQVLIPTKIEFWNQLATKMLEAGITPVVWQDVSSHDISKELGGNCVYVSDNKIMNVLGAMRTTGCVLDVFSGSSRLSSIARSPYVACAERHLYNEIKEWEIDCLCNNSLPHKYIFSFPTILESGHWNELTENIVNKLNEFLPSLNRDEWPSTAEEEVITPYALVKKKKNKKIGTKFIKVERL